ncbi:PRD domain-containing protein [Paenibacillus sp. HWE-109]|uniref:PRD domain-containing protein n=1 Tax=Paenibacillus sp. HWE-109 TaxID=1306526 RepID=UPI001EDE3F91|nr:PRD domain-containing protein [Paenibacillus sp. HWE-109]UKS24822.1 PRD domain-containing protein [Paenibacillus sp. HWE-109]
MLNERIELIYASKQVDLDTYEQTPGLLRKVEAFLDIQLDEENAGSFTSHLMKAIDRIKRNGAVQECSPALLQQAAAKTPIYDFSLELLSPFNVHGTSLDAEAAFIASYLLAMTEEEEM